MKVLLFYLVFGMLGLLQGQAIFRLLGVWIVKTIPAEIKEVVLFFCC